MFGFLPWIVFVVAACKMLQWIIIVQCSGMFQCIFGMRIFYSVLYLFCPLSVILFCFNNTHLLSPKVSIYHNLDTTVRHSNNR